MASRKAAAKPATKPAGDAEKLAAMSKAQLADEYGPLLAKFRPLEKRIEALRKEFERRGVTILIGEKWAAHRSSRCFDGLDIDKAKAALGAPWCEANKKTITHLSWTASPLKEADVAEGEATEAA